MAYTFLGYVNYVTLQKILFVQCKLTQIWRPNDNLGGRIQRNQAT